jgi:hypothetical protein
MYVISRSASAMASVKTSATDFKLSASESSNSPGLALVYTSELEA